MIVLEYKHGKGNTDYFYVEQQPVLRKKEGTDEMIPTIQERRFAFKLTRENEGFRLTEKELVTAGELFMALVELTQCGYYPIFATILDCQITAEKYVTFRELETNVNAQLMNRGEEPLDTESL